MGKLVKCTGKNTHSIHQASVYIRISVLEQDYTVTLKLNALSYL